MGKSYAESYGKMSRSAYILGYSIWNVLLFIEFSDLIDQWGFHYKTKNKDYLYKTINFIILCQALSL